ncbi:MAG: 16S rRNA (cytosine(1402)-N(4))-methyltransferase, partial [Pelagibacteraceae bacterium]
MNISISSLEKKHFPVMLDEVIKICDPVKNHKTFLDCTFGGGGYSKALLKFPKSKVIALDRDVSAAERAKELERNNPDRFKFYNEKFSNLEKALSKNDKIDVVIFDLGLSMFQLQDDKRGFSFRSKSKIDMQMGLSEISAEKVINELDEKKLKMVLKFLGEEAEAGLIAKNIIKARNLNQITKVPELVKIIEKSK